MDNEAFASNINNSDSQIFKNIKYYVAGDVPEKVQDILRNGGAEKLCYFSDFVTHMICGKDASEDDLSSARELYEIPSVRWQWVLACAKLNKLLDTRGFIVSETHLFYKLIFSFSNVTTHDRNLLWALITYNGGIVQLNFDSNCTHLITTVAKGAKYEKALKCHTIKVVTPDWLLNSINSKQIAPYDAYHPRKLVIPPPPPPAQPVQPPPQVTTSQVNTEIPTTPTAQITGFEPTELPTTSTSNQAILDQLKQRMPWNQQTTTTSIQTLPSNQSRPLMPSPQQHQRNFQLISSNQPQFTAAVTTAIANMTQQKAALLNQQQSLQNKINQQLPTSIQQATTQQILTTMSNQIQHLKQQQLQAQAANQQQLLPQLQVTQQNLISQSNQLQQQGLNQIQQNTNPQQILNQQNQSNQIQQNLNQANQIQQASQMQQNLIQQQNQILQQNLNQQQTINQQALNPQNQKALNQQNQQPLSQQNQLQQQQVINQQNQLQQQQQNINPQNSLQQQQTINQQNQVQQQQTINQQNQLQQQQGINQQNQLQQAINQQNQLQQQQQALNQQNQLQQQALNQQNQLQQQAINAQNQIQQPNLVNQQVINQQQNIILKTSQGLPTSVSSQQLLQSQMVNSFQRSQLQGNTVHHQLQANQVNQQQLQAAGLQRQHILQTSLGQQQLQQQLQQQQLQQQQLIQTQQLDNQQKLSAGSNNNQLLLNENQQQNFVTKNQLQQDGSQHPALQNQKIIMSSAQQIQQQSQISTSQQNQLLQNNNVIQHQQITSGIGQLQTNQQQTTQNQQSQQIITQNVVGGATGVPPPRLATPLQRQQQLHTAQQIALNKQNNEAMIKQQRLLQQQQQLRIQQLQNSQNNQFVVQQQGTIVNRQQLPPGAVKPGTTQFVQGQPRPIGWQQQQAQVGGQPQQQILLQHRQSGLAGTIQRPPGWVGPAGQLPQRQLIQLDPQTNAQLQQMDPQQRQLFLQKIQKQRQFLMQRQVLQQQQQQQFAVIRGQVVAGQPQNGQWPQGAPRSTLVVQQSPTATATPALRLPVKPEEPPQTEQPPLVVNAKTKTALANMLSIRLQSGGPAVDGATVNEPSAAGTLRLMTAQHNAALQQQRRTLNNGVAVPTAGVGPAQIRTQPQPAAPVPQTPPITGPPRAHFYGHNPNLKLPPNLFLLGCVFFVVEVENFLNKEFPTWQNSIRKHGGEIETVYCGRVTHVLCESQKHGVVMQALRDTKRCVTMYWLNDVIKKKQVAPPWLAMHLPTLYPDESPGARHLIATSGFNEEDNTQIKLMIHAIGARYTCYFSKHNTVLICAKPEGDKFNLARKCGTPVLNVQWLSDIMMGNLTALNQTEHARYQQFNVPNPFSIDYSLNPALMHGWKMPINITQESYERVKRSASPVNPPKPKKPKIENTTNVSRDGPEPRILFSQIANVVEYENIIARLGGSIATSARTATHLVMPKLSRSYKLVQCVAKGAYIVPESWLKDSSTANKFVSESNHTFHNIDDFNRSFNCDFNKLTLCTDRDKLFKNKIFYLTPSVFPPRQFLKDMIELSGGIVENNRRTFTQIEELNATSPHCYSIITDKDDLHLINDCLVHANSGKPSIVFNTELILSGILKQQLLFNEIKFAVVILTK